MASLFFLLFPGIGFFLGLLFLGFQPGWEWLKHPESYPLELWVIVFGGLVATLGGFFDWRFHRSKQLTIWVKERQCELIALGAVGAPLFILMTLASVSHHPNQYLPLVLVVLLFTVVMICYDEFVFHRKRCGKYETLLHRMLVFGNGLAWLAWANWCFVKGGVYVVS